jgi:5-methylcytosine-specific restriction endonuclease McrA
MAKKRDYKKEYKDFHSKPEQKKNRATRNSARKRAESEGKVSKGDGKEVDHKKPLSKGGSNSRKNTRVVSRATNRKKGNK